MTPRVGMTGGSYGGAVSLLAAGHDDRVDAIAPAITYWNLADALFPNGVFKKLWAGVFVTSGGGCAHFAPQVCAMYERVAESGTPDPAARELLQERSPSAVGDRIDVPTLLVQGQSDSLFPLDQADAAARAIRANGAPVDVDWIAGGHDGGDLETSRVQQRVTAWFDRYLKDDRAADTGPAFRVTRTGGVDSTDGEAVLRGASADTYPGLASGQRSVALTGREQTFDNPPGAGPPAVSALPGLGAGGGLAQLSALGVGISLDFPGQHARFESAPLGQDLRVTGSPTVTVHVRSSSADAVLFAKVYDVGPDGRSQVLPSQLVTPVRVEDARAGKDVTLTLPAIDYEVGKGHRLRLVLASTDLAYASPAAPATYTVSLKGDLRVPTAPAVTAAPAPLPAWVWWLPLTGAALALVLLASARRRTATPAPRPRAVRGPAPDHRPEQAVREVGGPVRGPGPLLPGGEGPGAGPAGPQRRGQDDHPAHADGPDRAGRRRDPRLRPRRPPRRAGAVPGRRLRGGRGLPAAPVRPGEPGAVLAGDRPPGRGRPPRRGTADRGSR
ncbi:hypothetical protein GCM10020295_53450 [Streptomyces cinereospinus]